MNQKCYNSMGSSNFQFLEESNDQYQASSKEMVTTNIEKISFEPNLYYKIINKITQGVIILYTCTLLLNTYITKSNTKIITRTTTEKYNNNTITIP